MTINFPSQLRAAWLAVLFASLAPAAFPADSPSPLLAIHPGRLVDVEQGRVLLDRWLIVRGDRIESLLPGSEVPPAGARVIDLSSYTPRENTPT